MRNSFFFIGEVVCCVQTQHSDKRRAPLGGCCLVSSPNFGLAAHWLSLDQRVLECESGLAIHGAEFQNSF
jgi:hypothetical protein